jgi:hypothetical protein
MVVIGSGRGGSFCTCNFDCRWIDAVDEFEFNAGPGREATDATRLEEEWPKFEFVAALGKEATGAVLRLEDA